jgi:hypothetical protein
VILFALFAPLRSIKSLSDLLAAKGPDTVNEHHLRIERVSFDVAVWDAVLALSRRIQTALSGLACNPSFSFAQSFLSKEPAERKKRFPDTAAITIRQYWRFG